LNLARTGIAEKSKTGRKPLMKTPLVAFASALILLSFHGAAAQQPVVLVHGLSSNQYVWNDYAYWFQLEGVPTFRRSYNFYQSNRTTAALVGEWVEEARAAFHAEKVDIVAHSMGAMSSRYYLKFLGGANFVDDWMSIGGVNYGSTAPVFCGGSLSWYTVCQEMTVGSAFLQELNAGDDTPGAVNYGAIWSSCDDLINPDANAQIIGGTNINVGCYGHNLMLYSFYVYSRVREFTR